METYLLEWINTVITCVLFGRFLDSLTSPCLSGNKGWRIAAPSSLLFVWSLATGMSHTLGILQRRRFVGSYQDERDHHNTLISYWCRVTEFFSRNNMARKYEDVLLKTRIALTPLPLVARFESKLCFPTIPQLPPFLAVIYFSISAETNRGNCPSPL